MTSFELLSNNDILQELAKRIRQERLNQNITQTDLAEMIGTSINTYKSLENHGKGTLENFVKVLRSLGKLADLNSILLGEEFSPIAARKPEYVKAAKKERASKKKSASNSIKTSVKLSFESNVNVNNGNSVLENALNNAKNNKGK